jgi:hypothetical protein
VNALGNLKAADYANLSSLVKGKLTGRFFPEVAY